MARDYSRTIPLAGAQRRLLRIVGDPWLVMALVAIIAFGLLVLLSAAQGDGGVVASQARHLGVAVAAMLLAAQVKLHVYLRWSPAFYLLGVVLLVVVLIDGATVKGAQRWLDLPGLPRFQPSELMKLAVPMTVAWYLHDRPLPPGFKDLAVVLGLTAVPAGLIAAQPDLGTGLLVAAGGAAVILLSGIRWQWLLGALGMAALAAPVLWAFLYDYQKARVLTFLDPERDPLGAGWNIIQSQTALGSGGFAGKGLFAGTQSQLDFLPESQTDFIVAVIGEELGLVGVTALLALYLVVIARGLVIAARAPNTFGRLAAGGLTLVFFTYVFVNIAMVSGLLPVVGVPLPLVSYGGTSAITLLAGFGVVMAMHRPFGSNGPMGHFGKDA